ncbi:MBL fold metallo-hydrolase [Chryseobacterium carnipullorum]|uniref:Ribonuclease BN n=1 Tax=Chryseobacterium carnipullorum TaxID=1124835 RepID=A0A376E7J5_CHRCU|nr:MBL fold metallo-hydrolase [Chryseobacterium carnipullorum]STD03343.1 Ribonuclease BN [Chryseobacterium carnipullorum]
MSTYLTILGFNSAIPTINSSPTAQLLEIEERHFLIDCGEGTQVQLRKAKARFSKINHIFISHLHGDHCFGLPGLIASFRLLGRDIPLHVYGPKGIKKNAGNHFSDHRNTPAALKWFIMSWIRIILKRSMKTAG